MRSDNDTRFILIRHAQSVANDLGIVQGVGLDVPLTEKGRHQAELLARYLANTRLDRLYASKARRAIDTAAAILKYAPKIPYAELSELNERSKGGTEGMSKDDFALRYPEIIAAWGNEEDMRPPLGGENFEDVSRRVMPVLESHAREYPGGNLAYVIHGNVIRAIIGTILGAPYGRHPRIGQDYCSINSVRHDPKVRRWVIEYANHSCKPQFE
ncbi:MAG: histidine phosphatase family protein [Candidatus Vogelbacteria bacterium]|nr:histidine phosphatase family protein [Candidatus Vogelbacteria bacterium]